MTVKLPAPFAELEQFVDDWALATETERYTKRITTPMEDIQAFYDAIFPRGKEILDYLDSFSMEDLPEDVINLLRMMYSLVIVSIAVEAWKQPRIPDTGASEILCLVEPIP